MKKDYAVIYTGKLLAGADIPNLVPHVAQMFQVSNHEARAFIYANKACVIKKGISRELAVKYRSRMERAGLEVVLKECAPVQSSEDFRHMTQSERKVEPQPDTCLSGESMELTDSAPVLWNPNAAVNWSLLLTPAFGSYLHMRNWEALGESEKVAASRIWFFLCLVTVVGNLLFWQMLLLGRVGWHWKGLFSAVALGLLLAWYYGAARDQARYVKVRFGKTYRRQPWVKTIFAAFGLSVVGSMVLSLLARLA